MGSRNVMILAGKDLGQEVFGPLNLGLRIVAPYMRRKLASPDIGLTPEAHVIIQPHPPTLVLLSSASRHL